jgi:hypothetical protein
MRAWKPTSSRGSQAPRGDGRRVTRRRCQEANPENMNRGLRPPIRVLHIGRYGGVAGPATVEENSTIPPSPRVVKGLGRVVLGRVAVAIAIKGSRIARSRPTAARLRGRSTAKRLERASREPHNRFRRPIEVDTDSGLVTGYIPRGSLGWLVQLRQRQRGVSDHICGRGRDRRLGQISWSLTPRLPSVSPCRAAWRLPVRPKAPPGFSAPK